MERDNASDIIRRKIDANEESFNRVPINSATLWQRLDERHDTKRRHIPQLVWYGAAAAVLLIIVAVAIEYTSTSSVQEIAVTKLTERKAAPAIATTTEPRKTDNVPMQRPQPTSIVKRKKTTHRQITERKRTIFNEDGVAGELEQLQDPRAELLSVTMEQNNEIENLLVY